MILYNTPCHIYFFALNSSASIPYRHSFQYCPLWNAGDSADSTPNFLFAEALAGVFGKNYSTGSTWFSGEPLVSKKYAQSNVIFYLRLYPDNSFTITKSVVPI